METRTTRSHGAVSVTTEIVDDDFESYEETFFTTWRLANRKAGILYRGTGAILLPGQSLWRFPSGRIAPEPDFDDNRRECQFVQVSYPDSLAAVAHRASRLESLERGDWCYVGIIVHVNVDGRALGDASCFGYESDAGEAYLQHSARELAHEAIGQVREWFKARSEVAK